MTDGDLVYVRDDSSGRIHKRRRDGARFLVDERCNADQSGAYSVIENVEAADYDALCGHCFPAVVKPDAADVSGNPV